MSPFFWSCAALLLSAPLATLAQTTDPLPAHRFYAGLAAYNGDSQFIDYYTGDHFTFPVQATLGYQLKPRLALELSVAYGGRTSTYANAIDYMTSTASVVHYESAITSQRRVVTTSMLARYTLTRKASHRFQVDALGGISGEYSRYHTNGTSTQVNQGVTDTNSYDYGGSNNNLRVNLGPSFRYRFGERLEGVYDILVNMSVTNAYHNINTAMALGLRYRFGPS